MLKLAWGKLTILPRGSDISDPDSHRIQVPQPTWCNFGLFTFSRIKASKVEMTEHTPRSAGSCGTRKLSRKVEFYYCGHLVATVELAGMKIDGSFKQLDNGAFWEVSKLGYFLKFDGCRDHEPTDWKEFERELTGGHMNPCME